LTKYMGKSSSGGNQATNRSLSFTLSHMRTFVVVEPHLSSAADAWEPLREIEGRRMDNLELSSAGIKRVLDYVATLKEFYGFRGSFKISSGNDFPSDCGLAASASSFAAITKAVMSALADLTGREQPSVTEMINWSRQASGSSCRSFYAPWALWTPEGVRELPELSGYGDLIHQVVVVSDAKKPVSSSEAHRRITTSLLNEGRFERANRRTAELIDALAGGKWDHAFEITWAEFWDMHVLFETSRPAFGYLTGDSINVLRFAHDLWQKTGSGPLVTVDAGPNVHLLFKNDEAGRLGALNVSDSFKRVISSHPELSH
jgi:diphosphomevalonate decarboxylase